MKQYTVAEARKLMKELLDAVVGGEEVIITRLGQSFRVLQDSTTLEAERLKKPFDVKPGNIREVTEGMTPEQRSAFLEGHRKGIVMAANHYEKLQKEKGVEFCEHNQVKGFCKKGCK